jgi:hypothetical protein
MGTCSHVWQFLDEFCLEWDIFQMKVVKEIKINILPSVTFSRKSCLLWDNVKNYGGAREAANDNMAHARCMLDK